MPKKKHSKLVFEHLTDEQWEGNAPAGKGGKWQMENGSIVESDSYTCWFGGGEIVAGKLCKCEIRIENTVFTLYGLLHPRLLIDKITVSEKGRGTTEKLDSEFHAGKLFEPYFKKYMKNEVFQSKFGQLFIQRIPDCLNYSFALESR